MKTKQAQHSPLPLAMEYEHDHSPIKPSLVAERLGISQYHAARIVRAVNAHEELLATAQALISELRWTSKNGQFPGMDKVIAAAAQAIAQADGK